MTELFLKNIQLEPLSKHDPHGVVFYANDKIYRAINEKYSQIYRDLFRHPDIDHLFEKGLIETSLTDYKMSGYDLILEHRKVQFTNYCVEWSHQMIRDAAGMLINLELELLSMGYSLKDHHPWNIFFQFSKPKFIDVASIEPKGSQPNHAKIFSNILLFYGVPLFLLRMFGRRPTKWYMLNMSYVDIAPLGIMINRIFRHTAKVLVWLLELLGISTEKLLIYFSNRFHKNKSVREGKWSNYYRRGIKPPLYQEIDSFTQKETGALEILKHLREENCKTVIDIGSNEGFFANLCENLGYDVVALDSDEAAIDRLYKLLTLDHNNILPVIMDFKNPTPMSGKYFLHHDYAQRFRCDVLLGMAIIHHLVFSSNMSFEHIAAKIGALASHYAIVEFIPPNDVYVARWMKPQYSWYTLENFLKAMSPYFECKRIVDSHPSPRVIILFARINS